MRRTCMLLTFLLCATAQTGCVERKFVIESNPPGALVLRNGQPIGFTPVDDSFVYYGKYDWTLVKDGYETLHVTERIRTPWYEIPPLDFITENLIPFKIRDVRRLNFNLEPRRNVRSDEVPQRAQELREKGKTLGDPAAPVAPTPPVTEGVPVRTPALEPPQ